MTTAVSFHKLALGPLLQGLKAAQHILLKGQAHARSQNQPETEYLNARLHPDMYDLIYQVQRFTDAAKFVPPRIDPSGPSISLPDTEKTFPEILDRVKRTIAYLESIEEKSFEGKEGDEVVIRRGEKETRFSALEYVMTMAQPNFWFHVTTTYAILRMKGVDVGKMDFLHGAGGVTTTVEKKE